MLTLIIRRIKAHWFHRPRRQPCDVCGRKVWVYGGDGGALLCSEFCEVVFKWGGGVLY